MEGLAGPAGGRRGLPEEARLGLGTEASVGVQQLRAKGAARANALRREEAKPVSRAKTSEVKLEGKDNPKAFSLTIGLGRTSDHSVIGPLTLQVL